MGQSKGIPTLQTLRGCCFSGYGTSSTDVCGDEDLLLPVAESLNHIGPLHYGQLCRQHGDLVPILAHLHRQPVRTPASLDAWERQEELLQQLCCCCSSHSLPILHR